MFLIFVLLFLIFVLFLSLSALLIYLILPLSNLFFVSLILMIVAAMIIFKVIHMSYKDNSNYDNKIAILFSASTAIFIISTIISYSTNGFNTFVIYLANVLKDVFGVIEIPLIFILLEPLFKKQNDNN